MADGEQDQTGVEIQGRQVTADVPDAPVSAPGATRKPTGDPAVDEALGQLDQVSDKPLDVQVDVGEQVHAVLQDRLADLGQE